MPAGRVSVQVSWGFPILEVCVVGEDDKRVFGPTQVVSPMGEGLHHGKQLSLVDIIISFSWGKRSGVVCDRVEFGLPFFIWRGVSFTSFLGEYCSNPICRGVSL